MTVPGVRIDLQDADPSVVEHWRGQLPSLAASALDALARAPSEDAVLYATHHLAELSAEDWRALDIEGEPTVAEVLGRLRPVALWGDPADDLHLDLSLGEDLTQYVLSFEVHRDGTLGDAVMES